MSRLRQALKDLKQRGYAPSSLKQLSGGINSAVFQAKTDNAMKYALKLYPLPTNNDPRNRCRTEKDFLNHLQACHVRNTPTLLESNISAGWSLMSWIEGQKPTRLEQTDLREITEFIIHINDISTGSTRSQLHRASEACESLPGLIESIAERVKRLISSSPSSKVGQEAIKWINRMVNPYFQSISQSLLDTRATCSHWKDLHRCRIASPSDVGIHNTLRTRQGLHFLDFEYAGVDDLSKLVADWILQPEHRLDQTQEELFIELLLRGIEERIGSSWHARLNDIKPLIHIKWCLIMLNQLQNNTLSPNQLEKTMNYFESA